MPKPTDVRARTDCPHPNPPPPSGGGGLSLPSPAKRGRDGTHAQHGEGGGRALARITRRRSLGALLALVATAVAAPMLPAFAAPAPDGMRLAAAVASVGRARGFAALGGRIRHALGDTAADRLVRAQERRLAARLDGGDGAADAVASLVAEDFRADRVVAVRGWLLSEQEAALCVAAADRWSPETMGVPVS